LTLLRALYLLKPSRVNAPELGDNWFWLVGSVAHRFYCLEASPKGSSLESSLRYQNKK
jgi:hypothetical protein